MNNENDKKKKETSQSELWERRQECEYSWALVQWILCHTGHQRLRGKREVACCLLNRVDSDKGRTLELSHPVSPDISRLIFSNALASTLRIPGVKERKVVFIDARAWPAARAPPEHHLSIPPARMNWSQPTAFLLQCESAQGSSLTSTCSWLSQGLYAHLSACKSSLCLWQTS